MAYTNINIKGDDKVFNYIIEYLPTSNYIDKYEDSSIEFNYIKKYNRIDIIDDSYDYIKFSSNWIDKKEYIKSIQNEYDEIINNGIELDNNQIIPLNDKLLPKHINISEVNIYYPIFSIDTYSPTLYMLTVNTWVNGKYIYLGSYLLNRNNALASPLREFNGLRYYEYTKINIINPYEIIYSDDWTDFRNKVCGEPLDEKTRIGYNNTGSLLNFTLYAVESTNAGYITKELYSGGQNSINISTKITDYFGLSIEEKFTETGLSIKYNINFNEYYKNDLNLYLNETYNIKYPLYKCKLLILDKNDPNYNYFETKTHNLKINDSSEISIIFDKYDITDYINYGKEGHFNLFDSWDNWKPGLVIIGALTIYSNDQSNELEESELLYLLSNEIPITKELYKYLFIDDFNIKYIDLNNIDMKHYNISAVNKIVNNIIQIDKPEDSKASIIQPIYFRVRDLNDIIIHPEVTENICINLDRYKSKTDKFILQIEGVKFNQISSIQQGVIFKINGNFLPNEKKTGIFYILDNNMELITTGKYTYEQ